MYIYIYIYSITYLDSWVFGDSVFSFESMGLLFMFLTFSKANSESSHENRPLKPQKERTAVLKHMSIFQGFRCLFVGLRGCQLYTCIHLFDRFFDGHESKGGLKTRFFVGLQRASIRIIFFMFHPKWSTFFSKKDACFCCHCFGWVRSFQNHPRDVHVQTLEVDKSWPYYKWVISGVKKKITLLKRDL